MNKSVFSQVKRLLADQSGQALYMVGAMIFLLCGICGFVIDFGHVYFSYQALIATTNAAALAGSEALPNSTATTQATTYSSVSGDHNARYYLPGVSMASGYPKILCLTTLTNQGIACVSPGNGNAVQVKQQMSVVTPFLAIFGQPHVNISATATAAARGAISSPYNVAIIIDTTASMSTQDTDCGATRLSCALSGVQTLLQNMAPCGASYSTCSISNGVATGSVDRVSLFTFPNVTVGTASKDYTCPTSDPTIPVYSFPTVGASTYAPSGSTTATYEVTPFWSDYKTSDTASSLNASSYLVQAVGGKSGCTGMPDPGGDGTYYAGAIYAAQSALTAEVAANPGSQNVMIILSDGEANASSSKMNTSASGYNNTGTYPSAVDQCAQAVTAAQYATAHGTRVYSVAYGSESSGCSTSSGGTDTTSITPCQTMQDMASSAQYFYSDYNQSGSGSTCQSASQPTTNLKQIFTEIAGDFTLARLIPNNTP